VSHFCVIIEGDTDGKSPRYADLVVSDVRHIFGDKRPKIKVVETELGKSL
jgi:hypothetical protein